MCRVLDQLIELMSDETKAPADELPDTGIDKSLETLLSSCFIASPDYGTRNTSALLLRANGILDWTEQHYIANGVADGESHFSVNMTGRL